MRKKNLIKQNIKIRNIYFYCYNKQKTILKMFKKNSINKTKDTNTECLFLNDNFCVPCFFKYNFNTNSCNDRRCVLYHYKILLNKLNRRLGPIT